MKQRHLWAIVLSVAMLAGLAMTFLTWSGKMPASYLMFMEKILRPLEQRFAGLSAHLATASYLCCYFLAGFLPVFLVGVVFMALAGGSRQKREEVAK